MLAAGRCAVPVNPHAPVAELVRTVSVARPEVMIGDRADRVACSGVPPLRQLRSGRRATAAGSGNPRPGGSPGPGNPRPQPGSVLLLTSGSTGAPKAVELTEDRLLHVARAVARHNRLTPADRGFSPLPLFHINAQVVALLASLHAGAALLVDRRFRRHGFWEMLADRDVTWINAVPAILTILAAYPVPLWPPRLRFIRSASAPLPLAVWRR